MKNADIHVNIFKPHSCPSALSSGAKNAGVPIEEVLEQGQWSNCRTGTQKMQVNMTYSASLQ